MRFLWSFCGAVNATSLILAVSEHSTGMMAIAFVGLWASLVSLSYVAPRENSPPSTKRSP